MQRISKLWDALSSASPSVVDPGGRRQARLLATLAIVCFLFIATALVVSRQAPGDAPTDGVLASLAVVALGVYGLSRTRRYAWGSLLFTLAWSVAGYALALTSGAGSASVALSATIPLALVLAAGLLSPGRLGLLALLNAAAPLALAGLLPGYSLGQAARDGGVLAAFGAALVVVILFRNALERSRLDELARANQELGEVKDSLETSVAERARDLDVARSEAEAARGSLEQQVWQTAGQATLNERLRGEQSVPALAAQVIHYLCEYLDACAGALFVMGEDGVLRLVGSYAYTRRKRPAGAFRLGEGLVGQAALERQRLTLTRVPPDYMPVVTGLGETAPRQVVTAPFLHEGRVIGVVEIGLQRELAPAQSAFLDKALESVAVAFNTARARARIDELLAETQAQASALAAREEELRALNEELQSQAENLRASEGRLRNQQEELRAANVELEEKATILQVQRTTLDRQNRDLRAAQQELQQKAEELALSSKYKSEFLANMSHELRTPLNSLLILARMLAANEGGNLSNDQVESARIIYNSGSDLLHLINEILDLSKVEAGRMEFHYAPMPLAAVAASMRAQFAHVAEDRGLAFAIELAAGLPATIESDQQRVEQILKNLLANAFKFTERGTVRLEFVRPAPGTALPAGLLAGRAVAIRVADTGIGMTAEQQRIVFEAFQQADGSTSRKYGGTGLGLTISRELAARLGGAIALTSEPDRGSTFTLYLPEAHLPDGPAESAPRVPAEAPAATVAPPPPAAQPAPAYPDDRSALHPGDKALAIIEDDAVFARQIVEQAHRNGFKCLVADSGEAGLRLVDAYAPDAVILDLKLPGMSGWDVLSTLKQNPDTRHIPVHILSASGEDLNAYRMGAAGFVTKSSDPADLQQVFRRIAEMAAGAVKLLLLVEDDAALRHSMRQLLEGSDVRIEEAALGEAALALLRSRPFDCMILDLTLPDMTGFELLSRLNADPAIPRCPVIIYTGRALSKEEDLALMQYADSVIVKGVRSPERLLDETALFLHRVVAHMPEDKQRAIKELHDRDAVLAGRHVLIVDDDVRNAFALSRVLGDRGMKVTLARSGQKALEALEASPDVDLVLMDIMMPEMDGIEAIQRIRARPRLRDLPVLAITAKAMKSDQERCIAAGASDYLSKPVDVDRLFSMLRVWLYR